MKSIYEKWAKYQRQTTTQQQNAKSSRYLHILSTHSNYNDTCSKFNPIFTKWTDKGIFIYIELLLTIDVCLCIEI